MDLKFIVRRPLVKCLDYFLSSFQKTEKLIVKEWAGSSESKKSKRLVLFSHFDRDHLIDPYVVYYLQQLKNDLQAEIIFITTSDKITDAEVKKILPLCNRVISRRNIGLDFGSWKVGLARVAELEAYEQVIFANDSVYGPLFPLSTMFKQMHSGGFDLWGATRNLEGRSHIQSYFLVFEKAIVSTPAFRKFWKDIRYYRSKWTIIINYEVGLSQFAEQMNWKTGAFLDRDQLGSVVVNSTLMNWKKLIEEFQFPFLKTAVLKGEKAYLPDVFQCSDVLKKNTQYSPDLVLAHLSRIKRKVD